MLERMRIQNFKAWQDTGEIHLAPLTVFFGTNSSGKTSLHQLLLLLKQTAQSSDRQRVLHLGDSQTLVDLGTFSDMIFGHDTDAALEFRVSWRLPELLRVKDPRSSQTVESQSISFEASIGEGSKGRIAVNSMAYHLGDPNDGGLRVEMEPDAKHSDKYRLTAKGYTLVRQQGRGWPLPTPSHFHGFPDEAVAYFQNTGFLADLTLELDKLFSRIHYVGPLREYPQRLYTWSGEITEHVGKTGRRAVDALLAAKGRRVSSGYRQRAEGFQVLVARWIKSMGLIDDFKVRPIAKQRKEYEVVVKTTRGAPEVKLTDVGFGVSQVLPVIVECFCVPAHSIIVFEQPEIHLHPRVQADLADLFVQAIHTREKGQDRQVQIIVESHSEHFLRRLQRRMAEEQVTKDEVAMYFCEPGAKGASIRKLEVDQYGRVANWPKHFFGDVIGDTEQQMLCMIERMRREAP
jgi:predicted ATPase